METIWLNPTSHSKGLYGAHTPKQVDLIQLDRFENLKPQIFKQDNIISFWQHGWRRPNRYVSSIDYFNCTGLNLTTTIQQAFTIDQCCNTILWRDVITTELIRCHDRNIGGVNIDYPSIVLIFIIKGNW